MALLKWNLNWLCEIACKKCRFQLCDQMTGHYTLCWGLHPHLAGSGICRRQPRQWERGLQTVQPPGQRSRQWWELHYSLLLQNFHSFRNQSTASQQIASRLMFCHISRIITLRQGPHGVEFDTLWRWQADRASKRALDVLVPLWSLASCMSHQSILEQTSELTKGHTRWRADTIITGFWKLRRAPRWHEGQMRRTMIYLLQIAAGWTIAAQRKTGAADGCIAQNSPTSQLLLLSPR